MIAVADRQKHLETLEIQGARGESAVLSGKAVRATDVSAETAGSQAIRSEFGDTAADADAVVVVTFHDDAGANTRVAVTASGGADRAGLSQRLLAVARTWLSGRPATPLAQHLVDLRRTLTAKLEGREYRYFLKTSTGAITIVSAETVLPRS